MLTHREARQRCAVNRMQYRQTGKRGEIRVSFPEDTGTRNETTAYYTDDIDDAVLTAARMRRSRGL